MTREQILQELKTILVDDLDLHLDKADIADDVSLLEDGLGLDSVVLVELIAHLEQRFEIHFDDQNLEAESFENLGALADLVMRERAATAEPA